MFVNKMYCKWKFVPNLKQRSQCSRERDRPEVTVTLTFNQIDPQVQLEVCEIFEDTNRQTQCHCHKMKTCLSLEHFYFRHYDTKLDRRDSSHTLYLKLKV